MPSKNSINKPKNKIHSNRHANSIGKKRSSRAKSTTRSSTSRYNEDSAPKPTESSSVALYTGKASSDAAVTTHTLSGKRAKKLARNQKYIERRLQKDIDDGMQVDKSLIKSSKKEETETEKIRKLLWEAVATNDLLALKAAPVESSGTTIGVQSF